MSETGNHKALPPVWLIRFISAIRIFLLDITKRMFPGNVVLYEQFQNFWLLQALYVAAQLNIAEILRNGPKPIDELAQLTNTHKDSLYRLMRALASQGIFREKPDATFRLSTMARALMENQGSMRNVIIHHLGGVNWNVLGNLIHTIKTGENVFVKMNGMPVYDYLNQHPSEFESFDRSMSELSNLSLDPILKAYNFSRVKKIADIGGGEGSFLAGILNKYPKLTGILIDQPKALEKASLNLEKCGVLNRVDIITADFFTTIPPGAQTYILKNVLHNWCDEDCIKILKQICLVLPADGSVIIIEMVIPGRNKSSASKLLDLQMLATMEGGKERTKQEFTSLLQRSGLIANRFVHTISPLCIIEARKV